RRPAGRDGLLQRGRTHAGRARLPAGVRRRGRGRRPHPHPPDVSAERGEPGRLRPHPRAGLPVRHLDGDAAPDPRRRLRPPPRPQAHPRPRRRRAALHRRAHRLRVGPDPRRDGGADRAAERAPAQALRRHRQQLAPGADPGPRLLRRRPHPVGQRPPVLGPPQDPRSARGPRPGRRCPAADRARQRREPVPPFGGFRARDHGLDSPHIHDKERAQVSQGPASVYLKNARFLLTMDPQRRLLENVSVAVAGDSIAAIGADSELADEWVGQDTKVIDAAQMFVTPGLVNSHIHLESCYDKGLLDDLPVVPWCERYFSYTYGTLTDESYYYAAMMSLLAGRKTGTTCVSDCGTIQTMEGSAVRALADIGMRGVLARDLMDIHGA